MHLASTSTDSRNLQHRRSYPQVVFRQGKGRTIAGIFKRTDDNAGITNGLLYGINPKPGGSKGLRKQLCD